MRPELLTSWQLQSRKRQKGHRTKYIFLDYTTNDLLPPLGPTSNNLIMSKLSGSSHLSMIDSTNWGPDLQHMSLSGDTSYQNQSSTFILKTIGHFSDVRLLMR